MRHIAAVILFLPAVGTRSSSGIERDWIWAPNILQGIKYLPFYTGVDSLADQPTGPMTTGFLDTTEWSPSATAVDHAAAITKAVKLSVADPVRAAERYVPAATGAERDQ